MLIEDIELIKIISNIIPFFFNVVMIKSLLVVLFFVVTGYLNGQIKDNIDAVKNDFFKNRSIKESSNRYFNNNEYYQVISELSGLLVDEDKKFHWLATKMFLQFINEQNYLTKKQEIVYVLIEKGLALKEVDIDYLIVNNFLEFSSSFFNTPSKGLLSRRIIETPNHFAFFMRLAGQIGLTDMTTYIEGLVNDKKTSEKVKWQSRLALAKMGDPIHKDYCINRIKSVKANNEVIDRVYPDLIYLNDKDSYQYLFDVIMSDEKGCTSTDPDNELPMLCAYRIIELIATHIENFPVKVLESGDLAVSSYSDALIDVRDWIINNRHSFILKEN
ncbi:MAG: hypothetical protein JW717_05055 [Marinilabiliaceae bacterium]|nr:hypothetical protein [Marinilabiliaceae bacterium]